MSAPVLRSMREITDKEVIHVRTMRNAGGLLAHRRGADLREMLSRHAAGAAAGHDESVCATSSFSGREHAIQAFCEALARPSGPRLRGHAFSCGARSVAMTPLSDGRVVVETHDLVRDEQIAWLAHDRQDGIEHFVDLVRWVVSTPESEQTDD